MTHGLGVQSLGAIVLAAGGSSRLGHPKQLIIHAGETLVRHAALAALEAGADPIVVVLGSDAARVAPELNIPSVQIVINENWENGLASSLSAGLHAITAKRSCDAVMVTLADQPLVDSTALERLISAFDANHRIVAAAYAGTVGVPAIFGSEHIPELLLLEGDTGASKWMRARIHDVTAVPLPEAELDIDTQADAARWQGWQGWQDAGLPVKNRP